VPPGLVLLVGTMTFVALTAFVPLYTDSLGINYAPILALYGVVIIAVRGLGASLPDRLGRMRTASLSIIAISSGMGIMALWGTAYGLYTGVFVWALGISMLYPTLMVSAIEGVPDRERATVTGSFTMFFEVSGGIGGPVLGVAAALGGNRAAFATAAVVAATGLPMLHAWTARSSGYPAAAPVTPTTP
jgi:MFS family permease